MKRLIRTLVPARSVSAITYTLSRSVTVASARTATACQSLGPQYTFGGPVSLHSSQSKQEKEHSYSFYGTGVLAAAALGLNVFGSDNSNDSNASAAGHRTFKDIPDMIH